MKGTTSPCPASCPESTCRSHKRSGTLGDMFAVYIFVMLAIFVLVLSLNYGYAYNSWLIIEEAAQAGARAGAREVDLSKRCENIRRAVNTIMRAYGKENYTLTITPSQDGTREVKLLVTVSMPVRGGFFDPITATLKSTYVIYPETLKSLTSWEGCQ